jgi:hypothetical protein
MTFELPTQVFSASHHPEYSDRLTIEGSARSLRTLSNPVLTLLSPIDSRMRLVHTFRDRKWYALGCLFVAPS